MAQFSTTQGQKYIPSLPSCSPVLRHCLSWSCWASFRFWSCQLDPLPSLNPVQAWTCVFSTKLSPWFLLLQMHSVAQICEDPRYMSKG